MRTSRVGLTVVLTNQTSSWLKLGNFDGPGRKMLVVCSSSRFRVRPPSSLSPDRSLFASPRRISEGDGPCIAQRFDRPRAHCAVSGSPVTFPQVPLDGSSTPRRQPRAGRGKVLRLAGASRSQLSTGTAPALSLRMSRHVSRNKRAETLRLGAPADSLARSSSDRSGATPVLRFRPSYRRCRD